jgi:hypothetical protein
VPHQDQGAHDAAKCARLRKKRNGPASDRRAGGSDEPKENEMKLRWIILAVAGAILVAAWAAVAVGYVYRPSLPVWVAIVTTAAVASEGFLWVAAGVFGWGFLAKRRAALGRLRDRLFDRRRQAGE